ncbi:hypothetical protein CEUSTIGMA_g6811.t1 [Chlamydomonas eustigma]|uniref:Exoribonuclease phosphorolytic domain-containing protein n=1 Tax=Chlamydomonas eustigma TaxID=1157962 RepID=A0A250X8X0_9CHLO|nr:hypothetical protein CEUSTIGMA_g6811.t1 [Chlamydomonas eustigma]|eukprot:GAX79369.1 hypothetical protein CEUSTIGMA_g6811.t1 [Chlamydomonas eustigma]
MMDTDASIGPSSLLLRTQGRQPTQLRGLACERGLLNRADGSAKWAQDATAIIAAVHGPRQAQAKAENAEHAVVEVSFKPRSGFQDNVHRDYEGILRRTLEGLIPLGMFPRTSIMVVIQVVQDDGALLSCALNAACAALIDAGVPLNHLLASVTCAIMPVAAGSSLCLDPTRKEEQAASALISIAHPFHFDFTKSSKAELMKPVVCVGGDVLASHTQGSFSVEQYLDAVIMCSKASAQIAEFSRLVLSKA